MAGREKRKRKRRDRRPRPAPATPTLPPAAPAEPAPRKTKNEIARERLEPLAEGERPAAVTVAAIVAAVLAVSNLVSWLAGTEIGGRSFTAGEVLPQVILMLVAAVGMWYARYWAVLGFQAILAILVVIMSLLLMRVENVLGALVALTIMVSAGTLFWFLVKALARIQMPDRRPPP